MSKAKLKDGVIVRPNGPASKIEGKVDNDVALYLLESGSAKEDDFEVLPAGYTKVKKLNPKDDAADKGKTKELPAERSAEAIQAALKAFDVKGEKAYEDGKQLVKELKLAPKSNKKPDIFEAVLAAQKAAEAPADTQE